MGNKKACLYLDRLFKRLEGYARLSEAKGGEPLENKKACLN
jgi:hypothetical protein